MRGGDDDVDVVLIGGTLAKDNLKLTPVKGVAAPAEQSEKPDKFVDLRGAVGPCRAFYDGPEYG